MNPNESFEMNDLLLGRGCKILDIHPCGILAIEKGTGVLSHPNSKKASNRTLLSCPFNFEEESYCWMDRKGQKKNLFLVHRLDSATSGVMLTTNKQDMADLLKDAFSKQVVEKTYHALVHYNGQPIRKVWQDCMNKQISAGKIRVTTSKHGVSAVTNVTLEKTKKNPFGLVALLKLRPKTGRTHQLRVQAAKRKLPILGDQTYGNFHLNRKINKTSRNQRLFLHASRIKIDLKDKTGSSVYWEIESKLPNLFDQFLK